MSEECTQCLYPQRCNEAALLDRSVMILIPNTVGEFLAMADKRNCSIITYLMALERAELDLSNPPDCTDCPRLIGPVTPNDKQKHPV